MTDPPAIQTHNSLNVGGVTSRSSFIYWTLEKAVTAMPPWLAVRPSACSGRGRSTTWKPLARCQRIQTELLLYQDPVMNSTSMNWVRRTSSRLSTLLPSYWMLIQLQMNCRSDGVVWRSTWIFWFDKDDEKNSDKVTTIWKTSRKLKTTMFLPEIKVRWTWQCNY